MTTRLRNMMAPALLIGASIALYFGIFIRPGLVDRGRGNLESSIDLQSYFLPRFRLGSELLFHGHLPVWNRFEYGGIPLLATGQPACLYPPKILLFGIFSPTTAYWIYLVGHVLLLAVAFLLFLDERDIRGIPAFVGAALFAFPVPLMNSNYHPNRISNLAWMPVVYVLAERVARGNVTAFALLSLTVAVEITAGYPEFPMDVGLLLAVHAIGAYAMREWKRPPWQTVPVIALAFGVGAVAAALQLLPLLELGKVAAREVIAEEGRTGVFDAVRRTSLIVVPGFVAFVLIGAFVRKGRLAAVGYAFCALIAGGGWRLLKYLPGFGMVRFGLAWVFLAPFFLAWAGAAGCDAVMNRAVIGDRGRKIATWFVGAWGLAVAAAWGSEWFRLSGASSSLASSALPWSTNVGSGSAAALGLLGGALLAGASFFRAQRPLAWVPALFVLTLAHLRGFPFGAPSAPFDRPAPTGIVAALHGRPRSIQSRVLAPDDVLYGYEITDELPSPFGAEISFMPWRYRQIVYDLGYLSMFAFINWEKVARARGFLDAMDVAYIAAPSQVASLLSQSGFDLVRQPGDTALFENMHHMGHAWVDYSVRRLAPPEAVMRYVLGPSFDPRREVVLEEPTAASFGDDSFAADPPRAERRSNGVTEFDVDLPRPGLLVFSESWYPGRTATVDGKPTKILRANYVLCAVELAAGTHTVRFVYDPPSVRWGLLASAVGGTSIVLLLVYGIRRKGRPIWAR